MNRDEELRYKAYQEIEQHKDLVESDPYRQHFHVMPPVGLLNDPNGFIQWQCTYHLFFQWLPFDTTHGAKFWGHYSSTDLVNWSLEPIALAPSSWYDKNGCYSGSAINHDGQLKLFYTGNVKDEHNNRETYQCLATSEDGIEFSKQGVVIELPEGYTAHFRDPKVWEHESCWYMVIGAQTTEEKGCVVLFQSHDLENWECKGQIAGPTYGENLGYMWECPDMFVLGDKDVFLFSPQGLEADGILYNNTHQSGYMVGEMDYHHARFNGSSFVEIDRGFDFYAPQTTLDDHGRRIMFGWMSVPGEQEAYHPTINYNWIHCMTVPRELQLYNDKVYQTPVEELKQLREEPTTIANIQLSDQQYVWPSQVDWSSEVEINLNHSEEMTSFELELFDCIILSYNQNSREFSLYRNSLITEEKEFRSCHLPSGLQNMRMFIDASSIEVFVNNGEEVFSARMFPSQTNQDMVIKSEGTVNVDITTWTLKKE
ncbi:glycoside hydrolase family 32 protein [Pontibacillus yanchengensis]|uniref:Sucrose-6-phosphate hydrolase n=1 Tax=Pontibacillus yanchengensis Y32 TaxID=1385514 RepID=A0A0A2T6R9_9BACI|nr:sucrose-6-phosphate hydrolase [Pontibacillus yanchengensis]KGP71487.1 sucrose-6-phosphate hydrolase [Pontibacillus yanchengensis Y32]